ncbi:Na+/H+ antiporter NhaC [Bacillus testis]|uniref:Na+/H+ antiporter NhaC n=1 Tax=Bacillus testis TaxID=1622072 RepID=UPI00067F18D7|nr:Na+/H+ antiporter NhaC [Bacillus testis]
MLHSSKLKLPVWEAALILFLIIALLSTGIIYFSVSPHLPMIFSIMLLLAFGFIKKVPIKEMERGLLEGASSGLGAIYIFFFIGMLISSWMISGTIPTLMYYGFQLFSEMPLYFSAFIVTSIVGICIGSAFTTSATIGVAFLGMASAVDASLAVTAGAIVSGAFLGDKMSPLSDTTNLASETVGVPLFEHIKNMLWTTVPGFVISAAIFFVLSPAAGEKTGDIAAFLHALQENSFISPLALLPFVVVALMAILRVSAIPTLSFGILSAIIIAFLQDSAVTVQQMADILFSGFVMESDLPQLNDVLSRGGIESMMFSVSLVLLALGMGGLLFRLGIIPSLLNAIEASLKNVFSLITATALTAIGINFFIGEQYLSILLTGKTYEGQYDKLGYARKTLARVLEDTGTVINPLIPWGVSGVFVSGVLGVSTLDYLPFAFFCLMGPVLTFFSAITKIGLAKTEKN